MKRPQETLDNVESTDFFLSIGTGKLKRNERAS